MLRNTALHIFASQLLLGNVTMIPVVSCGGDVCYMCCLAVVVNVASCLGGLADWEASGICTLDQPFAAHMVKVVKLLWYHGWIRLALMSMRKTATSTPPRAKGITTRQRSLVSRLGARRRVSLVSASMVNCCTTCAFNRRTLYGRRAPFRSSVGHMLEDSVSADDDDDGTVDPAPEIQQAPTVVRVALVSLCGGHHIKFIIYSPCPHESSCVSCQFATPPPSSCNLSSNAFLTLFSRSVVQMVCRCPNKRTLSAAR